MDRMRLLEPLLVALLLILSQIPLPQRLNLLPITNPLPNIAFSYYTYRRATEVEMFRFYKSY
jgi:hypothetical protein